MAAVLLWFAASFCYQRLPSPDLWWLLADGRLTWQTGHIPTQDPFSWTAPGAAWHNDQWLAGLLFYFLYNVGGLAALHVCKATLLLTAVGLALHTGSRLQARVSPLGLMVALGAGLAASEARFFFDVRAYLFTYVFLLLLWRWLQLGGRPGAIKVGALFTVWGNLHGGVSSGLLLLGLALAFSPRPRRGHLARLLGLAAVCSCLNPSGVWLLLHPLKLLGSPWGRYLNEWQPVWRRPDLFSAHLIHLAAWALVWWRTGMNGWDRCLAAFALFSLTGWRHIPLFALLSIPRWCEKVQYPARARTVGALGLLMLASAGWRPLQLADERQSLERAYFPVGASQFLAANRLPERMFQPYGLGGYLLWKNGPGYKVCIDGRAVQVYPWTAYEDYLRAAYDPAEFDRFCRKNDVRVALLFADERNEASSRLVQAAGSGWAEVYRDQLVAIYLRGVEPLALVAVETPYNLHQRALREPGEAEALLRRALQMDPDYGPARYGLAAISLGQGRPELMLEVAKQYPALVEAHEALAVFFRDRDPARSRSHAQRVRELDPNRRF